MNGNFRHEASRPYLSIIGLGMASGASGSVRSSRRYWPRSVRYGCGSELSSWCRPKTNGPPDTKQKLPASPKLVRAAAVQDALQVPPDRRPMNAKRGGQGGRQATREEGDRGMVGQPFVYCRPACLGSPSPLCVVAASAPGPPVGALVACYTGPVVPFHVARLFGLSCGLDHGQDTCLHGLGQRGPSVNHAAQIGVSRAGFGRICTGKCTA